MKMKYITPQISFYVTTQEDILAGSDTFIDSSYLFGEEDEEGEEE